MSTTDKLRKSMSTDKPARGSISLHHFQNGAKASQGSRVNMSEPENAEDLIVRYNDEFREFKKRQSQDSLSLVGDPEDVARVKQCRRIAARRTLAICCLGLWGATLCNLYIWLGVFYLWPLGRFVRHSVSAVNGTYNFNILGRYPMFGTLLGPPFILGAWGLWSAFCGRQKVLKSFFLAAPYIVLSSVAYLSLLVYVMTTLTPEKLGFVMDKEIGGYYHGKLLKGNFDPTTGMDRLQTYLKCCGIDSKDDWLIANENEITQKVPPSCCKLPNKNKPIPKKCVRTGGPTWKKGCKGLLFTFIEERAILGTAFNISIIVLTIMAIVNAVHYYKYTNQIYDHHFKYKWKTYFLEILPVNCCIACCKSCFRKKPKMEPKPTDDLPAKDDKDISAMEDADLIYKNPVANTLSQTGV